MHPQQSTLWFAIESGDLQLMLGALRAGADPNARNRYKNSALDDLLAWFAGNPLGSPLWSNASKALPMMQALIQHGAKVTSEHLLDLVAQDPSDSMLQLLLDNGADPNHAGTNGKTTLHRLLEFKNYSLAEPQVRLLLDAGADPNARDRRGRTTLHAAVRRKGSHEEQVLRDYAACVQTMLDAGADPLLRDKYGSNAIQLAITDGVKRTLTAFRMAQNIKSAMRDHEDPTDTPRTRSNISPL